MRKFFFFLLLIGLFSCQQCNAQIVFHGDMEILDTSRNFPAGWSYPPATKGKYVFQLDSNTKQQGKYSVLIGSISDSVNFGSMGFSIPKRLKGKEVQLRGYIKTQSVAGWAGFWLRIDGTPAFNNMQEKNIHGNTDWTEYSIKLPYNDESATNIVGGALLAGKGMAWFDNVQLFLDGKPIVNAELKPIVLSKPERDTAFKKGSGIGQIALTQRQVKNLNILGQLWGFVKYHHYEVAKGNFNMDAELFRVMPSVLKAADDKALSETLEQFVDKFGAQPHCAKCRVYTSRTTVEMPDYGSLFKDGVLKSSLTAKLTDILNNRADKKYYISLTPGVNNPIFEHEDAYEQMQYPDAGYRLLALYRYWNMVQYFYPYKHLIGEDWNKVLPEFIPKVMNDANAQQYTVTMLELICRIHDTHANLWGYNVALQDYRGNYVAPFKAKFIEHKLMVTGYYHNDSALMQKLKKGEVIESINGIKVDALIKKYLPVTAASNYETQLRDMPVNYLLRSNKQHYQVVILNAEGAHTTVDVDGLKLSDVDFEAAKDTKNIPAFKLMANDKIGYVYPGKYYNKDLPAIKKMFANTQGIIIDMRCYPSEFMPYTFVPFIKSGNKSFVKFTAGNIIAPGLMELGEPLTVPHTSEYKGKVVVIVNAETQSQAEYTTMAFQSSPNVTVIGSITAGADGNVSMIKLPGGLSTMISGLGVLYPDGTETQRKGVKIDEQITPTIAGFRAGKDELLERAQAIIFAAPSLTPNKLILNTN